ncbi:MAG: hypothetical protein R3C62_01415 [Chloroflexota bacterium]
MAIEITETTIILDASCIINLYASGFIEEILQSIPKTITVTAYVVDREALWIRKLTQGVSNKEPIQLQPLIDSGLLTIVDLTGDEEFNLHLYLSSKIRDEGESRTGAIGLQRRWAIGLDDHKARRIFQETAVDATLLYTLDLVKHWAEVRFVAQDILTTALCNIRWKAAYAPRKANPYREWWLLNGGPG